VELFEQIKYRLKDVLDNDNLTETQRIELAMALTEIDSLTVFFAKNKTMLYKFLSNVEKVINEAHSEYDQDREMKAFKLLTALITPGMNYRPDINEIHSLRDDLLKL